MVNKLQGSIVAIVTPMHDDGSLDLSAFDRLLEWHIEAGTAGIVVAGTTGESATLTIEENCNLVAHCVAAADKRILVIAGTGSNCTEEALFMTESARAQGADACLLVTPYYNRPPQEGLYRHFMALAETVDIPQILYNVPSRTSCDLAVDTVDRLANHKNIVAIKDATGELSRGVELLRRCGDRLSVYSGEDSLALPLMLAGGAGVISVTANVAPALMASMCALALAGEEDEAAVVDKNLSLLHQRLFVEANPVPVKWALHKMGRIGGGIRLPLVELDSKYELQVLEAMQQARIELPETA